MKSAKFQDVKGNKCRRDAQGKTLKKIKHPKCEEQEGWCEAHGLRPSGLQVPRERLSPFENLKLSLNYSRFFISVESIFLFSFFI